MGFLLPSKNFLEKTREHDLRMAFNPFVRTFLQLGQTREVCSSVEAISSDLSSVKCTSTRVLSEYSCRLSSVDAGQIGVSLIGLEMMSSSVAGVNEGTQNEAKADLELALHESPCDKYVRFLRKGTDGYSYIPSLVRSPS